jgi:uncharacterized membrane protein
MNEFLKTIQFAFSEYDTAQLTGSKFVSSFEDWYTSIGRGFLQWCFLMFLLCSLLVRTTIKEYESHQNKREAICFSIVSVIVSLVSLILNVIFICFQFLMIIIGFKVWE